MGVIFDGRKYADRKTEELKKKAVEFADKNNRRAKLATIYNPEDRASVVYTNVKEKKAEEIGVLFEKYSTIEFKHTLGNLVPMLNEDQSVDGIMVQVPLGIESAESMIEEIDPRKDVDGLREASPFVPATVRSVMEILKIAFTSPSIPLLGKEREEISICVLGSKGVVGSGVINQLHQMDVPTLWGMDSDNLDLEKLVQADVIISATGVQGAFTPEMVKDGVILIDIGFPKGDFDQDVAKKAKFFTPVPGGVGPVTVVSLFANLLKV